MVAFVTFHLYLFLNNIFIFDVFRDGKEFSPTIGFFVDVAPSQVCESVFPSLHFNTP